MSRLIKILASVLLLAVTAGPVAAQPFPPLRPFQPRPGIEEELRANPGLMRDPAFLQQHPGLGSFLSRHPDVREEAIEHPYMFQQRDFRFQGPLPPRDFRFQGPPRGFQGPPRDFRFQAPPRDRGWKHW